jgi:signal transduction histidine kinase
MLKILDKSWQILSKEISLKQLWGLATVSKHNYQKNIFTRTWWNIIIFHTFFVTVMVVVFGFILYYTKLNIFTTINEMLQVIIQGGVVDPTIISDTSAELDQINLMILIGMVIFSTLTGVIAAHITLVPTRDEFAQRKKFITAVAHELRTPLAVLRTANEVALYDAPEGSPWRTLVSENIDEIRRMSNILNNLVVFSRVGAEESLYFESVHVHEIIDTVINKLTSFAQKRKVTLAYTPDHTPYIFANKTAIEQIIYNLVKNAIIYSKDEGGVVTIKTAPYSKFLAVSVSDTGIGMSKKDIRHIFEPFYRVNPDSTHVPGTGLGLSLVFEIMKLHKGIITVQSELGVGTTFTLQLPLQESTRENDFLLRADNSISFSFNER